MKVIHSKHPLHPLNGGGNGRRPETGTGDVTDQLGRALKYLRISVTDRCNFRCGYCMPKSVFGKNYSFLERSELLSYEEITRCVRILSGLGVSKVRLTGGEPLLRRDIDQLIENIATSGAVDDIALTTNGSLLDAPMARRLRNAGLNRITVSLDSPDEQTFRDMTDANIKPGQVLTGIDAALTGGLPVKVNMVVKRGVNDKDILPMARYFHGSSAELRFIEYMDVGTTNDWRPQEVFSASEIIGRINKVMPLRMLQPDSADEVARRWEYLDGGGKIGVIASVTQPFCRDCSRLRLSAEGRLYTCLFATQGADICSLLRKGSNDGAILQWIKDLWQKRTDRYSEIRGENRISEQPLKPMKHIKRIEMSYIGG